MTVPYSESQSQVAYGYEPQVSYPPFQPSPARYDPSLGAPVSASVQNIYAPAQKPSPRRFDSVTKFNLIVGTIMLSILVIIPVWASVRLLYDETFVFFMGRNIPFFNIVTCVSNVIFFVLVITLLACCGRQEEAKSQHTFLGTFMVFVTLLGLILLLLAIPLRAQCDQTFQDLTVTCQGGAQTAELYRYYHALLQLRLKPACINQTSIEECEGYQESQPYTGFLKFMEAEYLCSGFCYDPGNPFLSGGASANGTDKASANKTDASSFVQKQVHLKKRNKMFSEDGGTGKVSKQNKLASMLHNLASEDGRAAPVHADHTKPLQLVSMRKSTQQAISSSSAEGKYDPVLSDEYPPTLFNTANYQASCDGMASRIIRYKAVDIAENQYLAGVFMLIGAIVAGVLRLSEMCNQMRSPSWEAQKRY